VHGLARQLLDAIKQRIAAGNSWPVPSADGPLVPHFTAAVKNAFVGSNRQAGKLRYFYLEHQPVVKNYSIVAMLKVQYVNALLP